MQLLDFQMPEWMRVMWVSEKARQVWQPRVSRVGQLFHELERYAVAEGVKPAALQSIQVEDLPRVTQWASEHGLAVIPIDMMVNAPYSSRATKPKPGQPAVFRAAVAKPDVAKELVAAELAKSHEDVGRLLGYPKCCRDFFAEVWGRHIDTTWHSAWLTKGSSYDAVPETCETLKVSGPPEANVLLRWVGVRAVSHLPHAFDCEETVEFGKKLIEVGRAYGFAEEMDWLLEMLSWPVEWSALHGIAVIVTPVFKISTNTDPTAWKHVVRRAGTSYPEEGATGLVFPFKPPKRHRLLTGRKAFEESIEAAISSPPPEKPLVLQEPPVKHRGFDASGEWYWIENGFTTQDAMDRAHKPVTEAVLAALGSVPEAKVLDLGAGNGALVKRIMECRPGILGYLVEINPDAADHARKLGFVNVWQGDLFDYPFEAAPYDVVLLMPGRLLEQPGRAKELVDKLRASAKRVVLYAYGDWLHRYGGLHGLMEAAGLQGTVRMSFQNDVAAADVVEEIEYVGPAES